MYNLKGLVVTDRGFWEEVNRKITQASKFFDYLHGTVFLARDLGLETKD